MDVCIPGAIDMKLHKGNSIEGDSYSYLLLNKKNNYESPLNNMMTFPFMAISNLCNGCMECVKECPTSAIDILIDSNLEPTIG